jgi:8-amino-7-oxononanoate synthase
VLDFTSSLYLGLRHPGERFPAWRSLTTGVPAALHEAAGTPALEARVAALYGCERASLAPSTLHVVWDVFGAPTGDRTAIYVDAGAYATLGWGAERAAARGVPTRVFAHHDAEALAARVAAAPRHRPIVACDGVCPRCGRCAPLAGYLEVVAPRGGRVIVDDTQAVGVLGEAPALAPPYGLGGGGTPRHLGVEHPELLAFASFAKAFGAPLAALLGTRAAIAAHERSSETRVHSSAPSLAPLLALDRALAINARAGDALRALLAQRVGAWGAGVRRLGLRPGGRDFPVQSVRGGHGWDARAVERRLRDAGVRAVVRADGDRAELCFVVTARHSPEAIERGLAALRHAAAVTAPSLQSYPGEVALTAARRVE